LPIHAINIDGTRSGFEVDAPSGFLISDPARPTEQPVVAARRVLKGFLSVSLGNLVSRSLNFVAVIYLARVLGPAGYGAVSWAQAALTLGTLVADLGLQTVGIRMCAQEPERASETFADLLSLRMGLAVIGTALMGGFGLVFGQTAGIRHLTVLFGLTLLASGLTTEWLFIGLNRMALVGLARALQGATNVLVLIFLVRAPRDVLLVPATYGVSVLAGCGLLLVIFFFAFVRNASFRFRPNPRLWPSLLRQALPIGISDCLVQVYLALPLLLVGWFHNEAVTGYYGAAFRMAAVLVELLGLFFVSLYPVVAIRWKRAPDTVGSLLERVLKLVFAVTVPVAAGGLVVGSGLLTSILSVKFAGSIVPFQVLLWVLVATAANNVYKLLALLMNGKQRDYLSVVALGSALSLPLNLILIPVLGASGPALAWVLTESTAAVVSYRVARQYVSTQFWPHLIRPLLAAAAMAGVCRLLTVWGLAFWLVIPIGALLYVAALLAVGGANRRDIDFLRRVLTEHALEPASID
jgi:O-antigen/teichoic acid export membrane protein